MKKHLMLSRIQTPDGTILTSHHVHDYVTHLDANGETYMLDGGCEYQRFNINEERPIDLSVWSDDSYEKIRVSYHRGGRGKNGDEPLKWVPMSEMSDEWLKNCIKYNDDRGAGMCDSTYWYAKELRYRKRMNISIKD